MTNTEYRESQGRSFTEHAVFVLLLLPTLVVLAAAAVSLARPDPAMAGQQPIVTAAACEPCPVADGDDGP